jgi:hypothetical protein
MLDKQLFEFASIHCANDYIMGINNRSAKDTIKYIKNNNLRVDNLILKPATNQIRLAFMPCKTNKMMTEVFNINDPPISFLRLLWDLDITNLANALNEYILHSKIRNKYDKLSNEDQMWITSIILGSKE